VTYLIHNHLVKEGSLSVGAHSPACQGGAGGGRISGSPYQLMEVLATGGEDS